MRSDALVGRLFRGRLVTITLVLFLVALLPYLWLLVAEVGSPIAAYRPQIEAFVFGVFASTCVAAAYEHFKLSAESETLAKELYSLAVTTVQKPFCPVDSFPPSNQMRDDSFNRLISQQMRTSRKYWFRGVTGQHVGTRLLVCDPPPLQMDSIILAIADPQKLRSTSPYVVRAASQSRTAPEKEAEEIRNHILFAVVALSDAAQRLGTTIALHTSDSGFTERVEHFDELVVVSMHASDESDRQRFPESHVFERSAVWYPFFQNDLRCVFAIGNAYILDGSTERLMKTLQHLGFATDDKTISTVRTKVGARVEAMRQKGFGAQMGSRTDGVWSCNTATVARRLG